MDLEKIKLERIQIEKDTLQSELSRTSFEEYCTYINPRYKVIATQNLRNIHRELIHVYQDVALGRLLRLRVSCPARLGKSELWAINLPTRFIGRDPTKEFVLASYSSSLATKFGKKARDIVKSQRYRNVFPDFHLADDQDTKANRETKQRWWMYTVWVEGTLTWSGWDILYIDDPVKDMQDAQSPVIQENIIDRYDAVLSTRKQTEKTAIVLTMTRWDINDLAWYLDQKEKEGGEVFYKYTIKAIDDQGFPIIWPGKRGPDYFLKERENRSFKVRSALFQQDPIAISGNVFKPGEERYFLESDMEKTGWLNKNDFVMWLFVDPAFSSGMNSDDIVLIMAWQHKITKDIYIFDIWADTKAPSDSRRHMFHMLQKWILKWYNKPFVSIEMSTINRDQTKFKKDWLTEMDTRNEFYTTYDYKPVGKKENRIVDQIEPMWTLNKLYFNNNIPADVLKRTFEQFNKFPNTKHDDIVDCIGQSIYQLSQWLKPAEKKFTGPRQVRDAITWQLMADSYQHTETAKQMEHNEVRDMRHGKEIIDPITGAVIKTG